jgi:hypothetical protein
LAKASLLGHAAGNGRYSQSEPTACDASPLLGEGFVVLQWERVPRLFEEHLGSQLLLLAVALVVEALDLIQITLLVLLEEQLQEFVHPDGEFVGQRWEFQEQRPVGR